MNEEHTFNLLRRISFDRMEDRLFKSYETERYFRHDSWLMPMVETEIELLKENGWTEYEFKKELYKNKEWKGTLLKEANVELERLRPKDD